MFGIELISDYPWYYYLLCILIGLGLALLTYQKNTFNTNGAKFFTYPVWLMVLLRWIGASLLIILLLEPVLRTQINRTEEPIVVIGLDNSASIRLNKDSAYYKSQYKVDINSLEEQISKKYRTKRVLFSNAITADTQLNFQGRITNLENFLKGVDEKYGSQNIGAIILASDGIMNEGQNPIYDIPNKDIPIYTLALGDTNPSKDLLISGIIHNKTVYSGTFFPIQIQLKSTGLKGKSSMVKVMKGSEVVHQEPFSVDKNNWYKEINVKLEAKGSGLQRYHIEFQSVGGEMSTFNNQKDFFVEVLESKRKILILAQAPHPDVSAIKQSIERNDFYEVNTYTLQEFAGNNKLNPKELKPYQLIILHGIPSENQYSEKIRQLLEQTSQHFLIIVSGQTNLSLLNQWDAGVKILKTNGKTNEVFPDKSKDFSLFFLPDDLTNKIQTYPPLVVPFGEYLVSDKNGIALRQRIGKAETDFPLLAFYQTPNRKSGILLGEGIWKWFLQEYNEKQNFNVTDAFIHKAVQYLSLKKDTRKFKVKPLKNQFEQGEKVVLQAELYNDALEPIKNASIKLQLKDEQNKTSEALFQPQGEGYLAEIRNLKPGVYLYQAETDISGKTLIEKGSFSVNLTTKEFTQTQANHTLLAGLSKSTNGKLYYKEQMDALAKEILAREDVKPVSYTETGVEDIIHYKAYFFMILLCFSAEWFLRRYFGSH